MVNNLHAKHFLIETIATARSYFVFVFSLKGRWCYNLVFLEGNHFEGDLRSPTLLQSALSDWRKLLLLKWLPLRCNKIFVFVRLLGHEYGNGAIATPTATRKWLTSKHKFTLFVTKEWFQIVLSMQWELTVQAWTDKKFTEKSTILASRDVLHRTLNLVLSRRCLVAGGRQIRCQH